MDAFMRETAVERTLGARVGLGKDYDKKLTLACHRGKGKYHRWNIKISNNNGGGAMDDERTNLIMRKRRAERHAEMAILEEEHKRLAERFRLRLLRAGTESTKSSPVFSLLGILSPSSSSPSSSYSIFLLGRCCHFF